MRIRVYATRFIEETKSIEIEVLDKDGRKLLRDKPFAHVWAEQLATFDKSPWQPVKDARQRITTRIEKVADYP
jgi:hypothetical protein